MFQQFLDIPLGSSGSQVPTILDWIFSCAYRGESVSWKLKHWGRSGAGIEIKFIPHIFSLTCLLAFFDHLILHLELHNRVSWLPSSMSGSAPAFACLKFYIFLFSSHNTWCGLGAIQCLPKIWHLFLFTLNKRITFNCIINLSKHKTIAKDWIEALLCMAIHWSMVAQWYDICFILGSLVVPGIKFQQGRVFLYKFEWELTQCFDAWLIYYW